MPSKYSSIDALPVPKDSHVKLVEVPERKVGGLVGLAWGEQSRWGPAVLTGVWDA